MLRHPLALAAIVLAVLARAAPAEEGEKFRGAVVCVDPVAAEVGASVLRAGGNAVDAAVATALALAVTWPAAGNLGGGGFLLLRHSDGRAEFLDFRETAPAASSPAMFLDGESGAILDERRDAGGLSAGVPGSVRGLEEAWRRRGTRPWKELVSPAAEIARGGFVVRPSLETSLARNRKKLLAFETSAVFFGLEEEKGPAAGERLRLTDLARTLDAVAEKGGDAFHEGEIARRIAVAARRAGGVLTERDLAAYRPAWREPVRGTYRGHDILSAPPPSSGGAVIVECLNVLEGYDFSGLALDSPETVHRIAESLRFAFRDRALHLGDPDAGHLVPPELLDKAYAARIRESIRDDRATRSRDIAGPIALAPESAETTHLTVADAALNVVSLTTTLNDSYGSGVVAAGTGVLLNNEMADFNPKPGFTDAKGRIGTSANLARPGRRMLSSMTPAIVSRDGRVVLALGSPGGRTIPSTVLQVIVGRIDFALSPRQAIDHGRFHHQWLPDEILLEPAYLGPEARAALEKRGHRLRESKDTQGDCHALFLENGALAGVADARIDGGAATP